MIELLMRERIGLWGVGREGMALLRFLATKNSNTKVVIFDDAEISAEAKAECSDTYANCKFAQCESMRVELNSLDYLVRSPGISIYRDELREFRDRGGLTETTTSIAIGIVGSHRCIGVTGTKGKSTTSALLTHILKRSGLRVSLAGNIGRPLLDLASDDMSDYYVVELSSYQISDLSFFPKRRIFTNLFQEHLDWHLGIENYFRDKARLGTVPTSGKTFVNQKDINSVKLLSGCAGVEFYNCLSGVSCVQGELVVRGGNGIMMPENIDGGDHMHSNVCAALACALDIGLSWHSSVEALRDYCALPHRQEIVGEVGGVTYVDDSIATIPEATLAALRRFRDNRVLLILGGFDRGIDYIPFIKVLNQFNVAAIAFMGPAGKRMLDAFSKENVDGAIKCLEAASLMDAVLFLRTVSEPGDMIILSPAATSYDEFRDFEERGRAFRLLMVET